MANTIAVDPQCRPSAVTACATSASASAVPPSSTGTRLDNSPSVRMASTASNGKRASRSTSNDALSATSAPTRRARSTIPPSAGAIGQLAQRGADGGDGLEGALAQHVLGELDVERVLEREHHVDAGVRGHAGLVQVGVVADLGDVDRQAGVLGEDMSDLVVHQPPGS